jgi:hypothetical protein
LGQRERNSLLTVVAGLAKALELDITQTSKTAAAIEALTIDVGARVAARTIENYLKRVPDAIERLAKE